LIFRNSGYCPICECEVEFYSEHEWFRDHYQCPGCHSIPRERALFVAIQLFYPDWRSLAIHESSPCDRGVSRKLRNECPAYVGSQFYSGSPLGAMHPDGFRCEDLENLTFIDESFDLVVTQDVMEHVLDPARAFAQIARTLKPKGAHIFTVPLVKAGGPSQVRAKRAEDGTTVYLCPTEYHDNFSSISEGSLVCTDWGYDISDFILRATGLYTTILYIDDISRGIRAELNEVLVSKKLGS
jgi:SAM-dependent methyltransferase